MTWSRRLLAVGGIGAAFAAAWGLGACGGSFTGEDTPGDTDAEASLAPDGSAPDVVTGDAATEAGRFCEGQIGAVFCADFDARTWSANGTPRP